MKKLLAIVLLCMPFTSLVHGEWPKKMPNAAQIYIEIPGTEATFVAKCTGTEDVAVVRLNHNGKERKLNVSCGQVSGYSCSGTAC